MGPGIADTNGGHGACRQLQSPGNDYSQLAKSFREERGKPERRVRAESFRHTGKLYKLLPCMPGEQRAEGHQCQRDKE
jgi:hypothetical protein